jgi:serine protease Do
MSRKSLVFATAAFVAVCLVLSLPLLAGKANAARGWLGVYIQDVTPGLMEAMDLKSLKGVLINDVIDDSPADDAGLERGDVVIEFNQEKIVDADQFVKLVRKIKPDDLVNIVVIREGVKKTIEAKIGKRKKDDIYRLTVKPPLIKKGRVKIFDFGESTHGKIGVTLWELNEQLGQYFGAEDGEGALVAELEEDGPAYEAGLRAGDVIVAMDGEKIEDREDVLDVLSDKEEGDEVTIQILRKGSKQNFTVEIAEEEDWFSSFYYQPQDIRAFTAPIPSMDLFLKEHKAKTFEEQELHEELEELKEELQDLKKELRKLKEEL